MQANGIISEMRGTINDNNAVNDENATLVTAESCDKNNCDINVSNPIRLVDYDVESSDDSDSSGNEQCPSDIQRKSCHNTSITTNNDAGQVVQNQFHVKGVSDQDQNENTCSSLTSNILHPGAGKLPVNVEQTVTNSVFSPECVSAEQDIKTEQVYHECDGQPSVKDVHDSANTIPFDMRCVLSVVEGNIEGLTLSNTATRDQQLPERTVKKEESTSTDESDSSTDSSSSGSESSSDEFDFDSESGSEEDKEDVTSSNMVNEGKRKVTRNPPKTKGELTLSDLPAVVLPDLYIHESEELSPLGEIESIMCDDALVIIKSFENVPAVDADSILFLEDRSCFGKVFDIFGRVSSPHYCVRFNSEEEITSTNIKIGQTVYFAPKMTEITNFVFLSQLNSIRGSDASWEHDQEPPAEVVEYSDDETESRAKATKKRGRLKKRNETDKHEQGATGFAAKNKRLKPRKSTQKNHNGQFIPTGNQQAGPPAQQCQQPGTIFPSAPPQVCGFVPPPHQQYSQVNHPPPLRIPSASTLYSGASPPACRLGGQREPFPPPLMDIQPYQPNLVPSFPAETQPRNFLLHQGRPDHLQTYVGQMSQPFRPPPPNDGQLASPPSQHFSHTLPPYQENWNNPPTN